MYIIFRFLNFLFIFSLKLLPDQNYLSKDALIIILLFFSDQIFKIQDPEINFDYQVVTKNL